MAYRTREEYNDAPVIPGNKKVWFLNGDLVRVHHLNRSNGIMSVYNIIKDQIDLAKFSLGCSRPLLYSGTIRHI